MTLGKLRAPVSNDRVVECPGTSRLFLKALWPVLPDHLFQLLMEPPSLFSCGIVTKKSKKHVGDSSSRRLTSSRLSHQARETGTF